MGEGGRLNDDKAARAILEYRNTPIRETERSPSMMLYARRMRDMFQIKDTIDETRYDIHKDFILASEDRERAYLEKTIREGKRWAEHTTNQKPLTPGQPVLLQSMKGNDKGQWTSSGTVWTANPDISQYNIKMDGSGRLVLRNRTNLRPIEIQDATQNKELELGGNAPPFTEVTPTTETKGPHEELNGETLSQPDDEVSPEMKSKAGEHELTQDSRHSTLNQKDCTGDNPGILCSEPEEVRPQENHKEARSLKRLQSDLVNTSPREAKRVSKPVISVNSGGCTADAVVHGEWQEVRLGASGRGPVILVKVQEQVKGKTVTDRSQGSTGTPVSETSTSSTESTSTEDQRDHRTQRWERQSQEQSCEPEWMRRQPLRKNKPNSENPLRSPPHSTSSKT